MQLNELRTYGDHLPRRQDARAPGVHGHDFLSKDHAANERKTWMVILLSFCCMVIEITCGYLFGSLALVTDGLHMSTHALAFLISASAYSYARKHVDDQRFVFGTGKVGDLAAYTSAILLLLVAVFILYDGICRLANPSPVNFKEAIPIAAVGLVVNVASGLLLSFDCSNGSLSVGHGHDHGHSHGHSHFHDRYEMVAGHEDDLAYSPLTSRCDHGIAQALGEKESGDEESSRHGESAYCVPCEPNELSEHKQGECLDGHNHVHNFGYGCDHDHDHDHVLAGEIRPAHPSSNTTVVPADCSGRDDIQVDNNFRAAIVHVAADAIVSVLVIAALVVGFYVPGASFLDPLMGCTGAVVILSWGLQLMLASSANLLDLCPDPDLVQRLRERLESDNQTSVLDLHVWRLGPGHLGAIIVVSTTVEGRRDSYYYSTIRGFKALSHVTIQVCSANAGTYV